MDALDMQLALGRAPGLTARQLRQALAMLAGAPGVPSAPGAPAEPRVSSAPAEGALPALFRQCRSSLEALGLGAAAVAALLAPDRARIDADRRSLGREGIRLVDAASAQYPALLAQTAGAPAVLYVKGDVGCLSAPQLAMVGSRGPTLPGQYTARAFAGRLSAAGLTITSGLAVGIDAASHAGALDAGGATIAVLGGGIDTIFPREHQALAERIAAQGALVSQYPPGSPPIRANFPRRNRIISGLALGTLVVEAGPRSGSLITARLAQEQQRRVFAIPGSIKNPQARGCHALIRSGAVLVESADQILRDLEFREEKQYFNEPMSEPTAPVADVARLDKDYKILLDALGFEPASVDILVQRTGFPSQSVTSMLLFLELEDVVGLHSGGRYLRL